MGKQWVARATGIILAFSAVVLAGLLVYNVAAAQYAPFAVGLSSRLTADYNQEVSEVALGPFRLSIIAETLKDLGMSPADAHEAEAAHLAEMGNLVPTATAFNFSGDAPYTPTALPSKAPPSTVGASETAIPTSIVVLRASPTKIATPTKPASATAISSGDSLAPSLSGGTVNPTPGPLAACSIGVTVSGLRVKDPGPSSGIAWVKLKYKVVGPGSLGYVYSGDLSPPVSGGWSGSTWDARYNGAITLDFDLGYTLRWGGRKVLAVSVGDTETPTPTNTSIPGTATYTPTTTKTPTATPTPPPATNTPIPTPYTLELWAIARDLAGNEDYKYFGSYTMPASCD